MISSSKLHVHVLAVLPRTSLEQLGLEAVKLGVPSVWSVWVGVDSDRLSGGELRSDVILRVVTTSSD